MRKIHTIVVHCTATPEGRDVTVNTMPDPHNQGARIVGFRIREGDEAWGETGLSEPIFWLDKVLNAAPAAPVEEIIAAKVEQERLRFEGDLDKWMKIIGAGITGFQPDAYALMDLACQELGLSGAC